MFGKRNKNNQPMKLVMANGEEKTVYEMTDSDVAWFNAKVEKQIMKGAILGACILATGMVVLSVLDRKFPDVV